MSTELASLSNQNAAAIMQKKVNDDAFPQASSATMAADSSVELNSR